MSICGQISQYNLEKPEPGPRLLSYILVKQARVEGTLRDIEARVVSAGGLVSQQPERVAAVVDAVHRTYDAGGPVGHPGLLDDGLVGIARH